MDYKLIRSKRTTIAIQIDSSGIIVRAPYRATTAEIENMLHKHEDWIHRKLTLLNEKGKYQPEVQKLSQDELKALADKALKVIPERVKYFAPLVCVSYGRITIRCQRTRWGSCSAKGNLNFNCLLMLAPPEVLDSVVVHELCHRKEMNHSQAFYREVLRVFPDYYKWNSWLKENGEALLMRIHE
ncbi:MAG: M48 family metallopeptidase [Lachnospiraceae bacterium]|nr:M48 family metallopeptidase [Lachnospiraceae bacterium]